MGLSM